MEGSDSCQNFGGSGVVVVSKVISDTLTRAEAVVA